MLMLGVAVAHAQRGLVPAIGNRSLPTLGRSGGGQQGGDSLQRRDKYADSISIVFNYLDTTRALRFDSSIRDYYTRFPIPYTYHYLGNPGTAAQPLLFQLKGRPGWDPGFHAFDVYLYSLENSRFFNTTRPYTELGYTLGSQSQQIIDLIHTQNLKPNWNASAQYRLIISPGYFKNQRTAHRNFRVTSWYQGRKKRYNNYLILLGNKSEVAENGGIANDKDYLTDPNYDRRFTIPVKLGNDVEYTPNPFSTGEALLGNHYGEFNVLLRQQYDFGRKDSIVTDSTSIPLFYPRVRFEHTFNYSSQEYQFQDDSTRAIRDSAYFIQFYRYDSTYPFEKLGVLKEDRWRQVANDFSIYTFPDAKNQQQFVKVGIQYQWLYGKLRNGWEDFYNLMAHGEYRNRTRNQKWNIQALGRLWWNGYNAGDYHAYITLQRLLSRKVGSLLVGFENMNRSPSFVFDKRSNYYIGTPNSFDKENTTHLFARATNPVLKLELGADYYLVSNYLYFRDFYQPTQESSVFSVLMLHASKAFRLSRTLNWYAEAYLQQETGNAPINIPVFVTRQRIAFEGNFYRNLHLSTGLDARYNSPYRMDHYSPLIGQFAYQDTLRINNRADISAFLHFRIRSFKVMTRLENINTINFKRGDFAFNRHNFGAPDYPYPGPVLRFSFFWSFVN